MKLVKLSLVAAMAAGVFATTASAVPLEEAIKNVDVSGYTRLRYTSDDKDSTKNNSEWNFKGVVNVKTQIDDNFFAVVGVRYDDTDTAQSTSGVNGNKAASNPSKFEISQAYFGYNIGNTSVMLGRQVVGAFFTDDMFGDGIKVVNSDIQGLTLAALYMDALEDDGDISTLDLGAVAGKKTTDHNLYGVAAIGSYDPVSFQLWYAVLEDVTDLFAIEAAVNFDVTEDIALGLKAQYGFSDFDGDFKAALPVADDADIYGVEASTSLFGLDFTAGYVDFSTDKDKASLVSFEDQGSFISPGEELLDYTLFFGENDYFFATAAYTIPNTGVMLGIDYLDGENKTTAGKKDMKETVYRVEYAATKKLKFKTWYSQVKDGDDDNNRFRFEAKYSF
ncbi:OprD family outer membrane porin [Campylobacter geochelonis]|uniref:Major outer membrane protein n=1 Tax=Campylobacter geochelonis TaxID=1780362 RepID=A0A128ERU2_9BACT|nr:OprD family outer membrane porin [Campylobacter geochelonis]QKF71756.1 major outer membrane protein [Campylobacter geochelonis]CZE47578.1 major outer membrane protein [Campylobacter geochelonis]CZE48504.1 major outer membrane protein [Campylobacter geochelonis]CZE51175.1 major outer membrane protein [Campylobacter geochelonis]